MEIRRQLCEHVLDLVALSIQSLAVGSGQTALGLRWNAKRDAAFGESLSECITIIALVGNKRLGVGQHWIDRAGPLWSLICLSVRRKITGRPAPSQTACGLEFSPPFVRPMRRP